MNVVLALEPDASQSALLSSIVRRKLGANLIQVISPQAAMVAMNHRVPDVLLFGRGVSKADRDKATAHLRSLSRASGVRTLEIPKLTDPAAAEQAAFQIRMCLAAAEEERVRAMANLLGPKPADGGWNDWNELASAPSHEPLPPAQVQAAANNQVPSQTERLRREADEQFATDPFRAPEDIVAGEPAVRQKMIGPSVSRWLARVQWRIVASVALVTLIASVGVFLLSRSLSTVARTSSTFVGNARKAARAAAKQAVDAAPVVTQRAVTAAERMLPHSDTTKAATRTRRVPVAEEPAPLTGPGFLSAFSRIPMDIYADGKRIGSTEDTPLLLKSGVHQIEFVSERFRYRTSTTMVISPDHVLAYNVSLPTAQVRVTSTPGAEVWIEGQRVGVAPLAPVQVPIGTREILVRDATGENRQVVEVKNGDALDLSLAPHPAQQEPPPGTPHLAPLQRSR